MYDYLIITHIPVFYKVNLYNELSKKLNIFVIFIASDTVEKRSSDFIGLDKAEFRYKVLNKEDFQKRRKIKSLIKLSKILVNTEFNRVIVSGWDLIEFWFAILFVKKNKNCLALESTILESKILGIKGTIKRLFLSKISTVFASGKLHKDLLDVLGFNGDIRITRGVGIINYFPVEYKEKAYNNNFLFIGRLSEEKNLETTINIFNNHKDCFLNIIGTGPLEEKLKIIANENIKFYGAVENIRLKDYFEKNSFLILPSLRETWGLVVEEALFNGLPVIVSENCGAAELVDDGINGYVIDAKLRLLDLVLETLSHSEYNRICNNITQSSIIEKDISQIKKYIY